MNSRAKSSLRAAAALALACAASANAEILSFNGNQTTGVTTHTINATDWADYLGGSGTFNSANAGGRLYWRGSAGDGQFMHFNLSSLTGLTVVSPVTITLQDANPTWGGGVNGSYVATADVAWTAGGGQAVPTSTAITNAVNATGGYGWDAAISWGIGYTTFQGFVDNQSSFYGLGVIGGSGSQMHFDPGMNPFLTVQTGTIATLTGVITADTGSSTWNSGNYAFAASNAYSSTINTLTISGELIAGTSGAGTVTINNGGTVAVNGGYNFYQAIDGTTINAGGRLTINNHSNISNLTLAGGELASTGTDPTWGSWGINGTTTVTGGVTSTISAIQVTLGGVFDVGTGSTLNFTGWASGGSLTKNGAGTMQFSGWQSYTGGTTINNGTLELIGQNSGNGWLRGAVTVNSGGTLKFTGGDGSGFGWNSSITSLTINGGIFDTTAGSTHLGFGNYVTVSLSNGGTITGAGQWNGDGLLGFSSSGDLTNTISGSWSLRSDNGANHTFNVADGAADTDLLVTANLSDQYPEAWWVSRSNLVKSGAGTMVLSGSNSYDGQTHIQAGTLVAASSNALGPGGWDGNTMSFISDGATLALQGDVSLNEHFHVWGAGVGGLGAVRSISGNNALTMTYGNSGSGGGFALRSNTTVGVDADTLTVTGFYEDGGSWGLIKVGAGTLKLTQISANTGGTTVNAGTLELSSTTGDQSAVRGSLTVNSGATVNITGSDWAGLGRDNNARVTTLNVNGGTVNTAVNNWLTGATVNLTAGTMNGTGSHHIISSSLNSKASATTSTISSALVIRKDYGSSDLTIDVEDGGAATDLLISGVITQAGSAAGVTKTGVGKLELTGGNAYTGATTISAGTLALSGSGSIANSSNLIVNGTLDVTGLTAGAFTVGSGQTLSGSGTINATGKTLEIAGTHAVGNSPGLQTITGDVSYASTSIFEWDIKANVGTGTWDHDSDNGTADIATRGTAYDAVNVTGNLTIDAAATFKVIMNTGVDFADTFWTSNRTFDNIWNVTGITTSGWSNAAVSIYNTSNELQNFATYGSFTITGTSLTWTAVPEPTSALAGLLLGAGLLRRRRRVA